MPSEKRKIGDLGEALASKWLAKKGYSILERNWWKPWGEIDIIAQKSGTLFFIEVKTVSFDDLPEGLIEKSQKFNSYINNLSVKPEDNVHPHKIRRLLHTIETYLAEKHIEGDWSLLILLVYYDKRNKKAKTKVIEGGL